MIEIALTAATAIAGGFIGKRLRLPAGFMLGALLAAGLLKILWPAASFPADARVIAQIIAGAYIGMTVTRKSLQELRQMLLPSFVLFTGISIIALISGFAVFWLSDLALTTALLSTVPGGIVDMSMISLEFGAQPQIVAALQLERLVLICHRSFVLRKSLPATFVSAVDKRPSGELPSADPRNANQGQACKTLSALSGRYFAAASMRLFYTAQGAAGAMVGAMTAVRAYILCRTRLMSHRR